MLPTPKLLRGAQPYYSLLHALSFTGTTGTCLSPRRTLFSHSSNLRISFFDIILHPRGIGALAQKMEPPETKKSEVAGQSSLHVEDACPYVLSCMKLVEQPRFQRFVELPRELRDNIYDACLSEAESQKFQLFAKRIVPEEIERPTESPGAVGKIFASPANAQELTLTLLGQSRSHRRCIRRDTTETGQAVGFACQY